MLKNLWTVLGLSTLALSKNTAQSEPEIKSIPLRTHTLQQPYLDSDLSNRWWDFGGDTIVRADKYVRLASDAPSQSGWLFSRIPLTATNWEIEVEFAIQGKGNLHGDGFALWVTKDRAMPGPVFGHKDQFEGLGIFFDTYKNNRPGVVFPFVMGMLGDGQEHYDALNDGKANEIGGCSARGLRGSHVPTKARITYFQDKSLKLELQYKADDQWTECFSITPADGKPIKMPNTAYLGFSAHTGELSDNFDIISVETKNLYSPTGSSAANVRSSQRMPAAAKAKRSGGWGWFLFKVLMFAGVCVGGFYGYKEYQRRNKYSKF